MANWWVLVEATTAEPSRAWISLVVAIIAFMGSVIGAWFTSRTAKTASTNTQNIETLRIEADAFEHARVSYIAAIEEQEHRIARLHLELEELRAEVSQLRDRQ